VKSQGKLDNTETWGEMTAIGGTGIDNYGSYFGGKNFQISKGERS
jgi:hypothetical protein